MFTSSYKRQAGSSLIEVLITVLIVSIGVLALAKFQSRLHTGQTLSKNRSEAQMSAKEVIAAVQANPSPASAVGGKTEMESASAVFSRLASVAVSTLGDVLVTVKVSWADSRGVADYTTISTLVAKNGQANSASLLAAYNPASSAPWTTPLVTRNDDDHEDDDHEDDDHEDDDHEDDDHEDDDHEDDGHNDEHDDDEVLPTTYRITGLLLADHWKDLLGLQVVAASPCIISGSTYECQVAPGWSGSVTASLPAANGNGNGKKTLTVSPAVQSFTNVKSNKTGSTLIVSD